MVFFIKGNPKKPNSRNLKIPPVKKSPPKGGCRRSRGGRISNGVKTVFPKGDTEMLKQVIRRRLAHREWPYPDLMLIDGGKAQLNAVISILRKSDFPWEVRLPKVVALAKRKEELYTENRIQPVRLNALSKDTAFFFQRVRDESHRFAKKYHHKLREILYREQGKI